MKSLTLAVAFAMLLSCRVFAQQACDYKVEILADGSEFEKEDFKWRMKATKLDGPPTNITGTAEIKSDGKTAKSYKPWNSAPISRQKTSNEYTPNLKPGSYEIIAEVSVQCDDGDKGNNKDIMEIKIKGENEETKAKKSKSENQEAVNNKINGKEQTPTSQNAMTTRSKQPTASEETDNVIQLNNKNNQKSHQLQATTYAIKQPEVVYKSSNEKAKGMIMAFLLTLSVLLNIILIWKR